MKAKREEKTVRLKRLEGRLILILKSKRYLESEIEKIKKKESYIKNKISKEKKAISLINRARRLR